jgi:cold shock CspA family protein
VATAPSPHRKPRARSGGAKFSVAMLSDAKSRMKVNAELAKTRWTVELKRTIPERGFGFVQHPDFEEDIFCMLSKIAAMDRNGLREGKVLNARITTSFDRSRQHWSFAVESGHTVE